MSTASPLPLHPLPEEVVPSEQQLRLKQEVVLRLEQHRRRRPQTNGAQQTLPEMPPLHGSRASSRVADSVAARFAKKASYRELLAHEAEVATRQAEAAAEVARRNAEAIADAQQRLLDEIEHWNRELEGQPAPALLTLPSEVAASAEPAKATQALEDQTPLLRSAVQAESAPKSTAQHAASGSSSGEVADVQAAAESHIEEPATDPLLALKQEPQEPPTGLPTNLIEFPRQLVAARKARPRLAEGPLVEEANRSPEQAQLRIFEVEPDLFSTVPLPVAESVLPEWSSIRLDSWQAPHETAAPDAQVSLAMPLYTAAVSTRCMAAAVDGCCLLGTFLAAVAVAGYASPVLPTGVAALFAAAGSLLLLGVLYLLFFFSFTDATPGMRYARIALCTFNDDNPTRSAMRRRLLATALSVVPMGLGLLWACLDDDRLGWHDRISRMYQREY